MRSAVNVGELGPSTGGRLSDGAVASLARQVSMKVEHAEPSVDFERIRMEHPGAT